MAPGETKSKAETGLFSIYKSVTRTLRKHAVTAVMSPNVGLETRHNSSDIARRKSRLITTLSQVSSFLLYSHYVLKSRLLDWRT